MPDSNCTRQALQFYVSDYQFNVLKCFYDALFTFQQQRKPRLMPNLGLSSHIVVFNYSYLGNGWVQSMSPV